MTNLPWQIPAPLPADDIAYFPRVAAAEAAIQAQGFTRDTTYHVWRHQNGRTAKVVRDDAKENSQFYIQWG